MQIYANILHMRHIFTVRACGASTWPSLIQVICVGHTAWAKLWKRKSSRPKGPPARRRARRAHRLLVIHKYKLDINKDLFSYTSMEDGVSTAEIPLSGRIGRDMTDFWNFSAFFVFFLSLLSIYWAKPLRPFISCPRPAMFSRSLLSIKRAIFKDVVERRQIYLFVQNYNDTMLKKITLGFIHLQYTGI